MLSLIVGLFPNLSESAPFLRNLNITSGGENSVSLLTGEIGPGTAGGAMTLHVVWGDATPAQVYSYASTATNFSVHHYYQDDNPSNTAGDLYTISMTLSNNTGTASTTLGAPVTNVPPRLVLNVNSPIEIGAPATLHGMEITEFPVTPGSFPQGIAVGPHGTIWFTESGANRLGRITTNGVITEFPIGGGAQGPVGIAAGSDDRLWFCAYNSGQIGAMTTNGVATMYTIPRQANEPLKSPQYIAKGGGVNMWYSDLSYRIGRISPSGVVTQFVYQAGLNPTGIAFGSDNNVWFTDYYNDAVRRYRQSDGVTTSYALDPLASPGLITRGPDGALWFTQFQAGKIGRISTNGALTEAFIGRSLPWGITSGPDGAIWFTERRSSSNSIARLTTDGYLYRYQLAASSDSNVSSDPREIVTGPDGALWFTMAVRDRIGRLRYTTSGNVVLSGNLNDPGVLDPHEVLINWGDGSAMQTFSLAPGIASFHVAHTYSGAQPFYVVTVGASDDDLGTSQASTIVVVNAIQFTSVTRSNGDVRLKGTGANGRTITIESSTDLQNWSSAGAVNSVSNQFEFVHPGSAGTRRFYRGSLP